MFDFISIGDAGIDTLVEFGEAHVQCSLTKEDCQLCFDYASKILAKGIVSKTAYNGMNVALAARRLGLNTALYATVGGDHSGERVLGVLEREGVDRRYVVVEKKLRTNASVVLNYKGERTILVYHEDYHYRLPRLDQTSWFYLTTMGKRFLSVYQDLAKVVKKSKAKLSFNPGTHQLKAGTKVLQPVLDVTTVLFLNKEEARLLTRIPEEDDIRQLLRAMTKLGPKIAVITDGPKGAYAFDGTATWRLPIFPAPIIERTGAGDSFGASFTAALCLKHPIPEAMRWGTINAASVVGTIGPQDGLLEKSALAKMLKAHPRFQAKKV